MDNVDEIYMRRALQLASLGEGNVSPNPMVGAVIVSDGRIIGEGFHRCYGEGHAEVNAVASVPDRSMLRGATIYVTLEPCSHYGKTPPCARLLIDCGFGRVVVGVRDPFPRVSGRGIAMLREAGIEVTEGVLEEECRRINRRFITAHSRQMPWVMLKWAQSADGFIDALRQCSPVSSVSGVQASAVAGAPVIFSTPVTSMLMHRERAKVDAVIVGAGTVAADNPSLTVRHWSSRRQPLRVVLGSIDALGLSPHLLSDGLPTLIFTETVSSLHSAPGAVEYVHINPHDLRSVLAHLYNCGITSVMVEGGAAVLRSFIAQNLWNEARVETAPVCLCSGVEAPRLTQKPVSTEIHGSNAIEWYESSVK